MKKLLVLAALALVSCQNTERRPHVDVMYGIRDFEDSSQWEQTDRQDGVLGIQAEFAGRDGWGPEIGFTYSEDGTQDPQYANRSSSKTSTQVSELYVGLRQNWMVNDWWQLSAGGGISAIRMTTGVDLTYTQDTYSDGEVNLAPYAQVGTRAFFTNELSGGVMYRYHFLDENADIFVANPSLDGGSLMFTLGWSF